MRCPFRLLHLALCHLIFFQNCHVHNRYIYIQINPRNPDTLEFSNTQSPIGLQNLIRDCVTTVAGKLWLLPDQVLCKMKYRLTIPHFKEPRNEVVNKLDLHTNDHITQGLHHSSFMTSQAPTCITATVHGVHTQLHECLWCPGEWTATTYLLRLYRQKMPILHCLWNLEFELKR